MNFTFLKLVLSTLLIFTILNSYGQKGLEDVVQFSADVEYTQAEVDSVITRDYKKVNNLKNINELKKILNSNKELLGWIYYFRQKSAKTFEEQKYDSVIIYGDLAIRTYEESKLKREFDEAFLLRVYYLKGYALYYVKEYGEALVSTQRALDLHEKYPYKWYSYITAQFANIHLSIGNDSIALSYYRQTTSDSLFMSLARPAVTTYTRMGNIYSSYKRPDSARYYFRKGVELSKRTSYTTNLYALYSNIGFLFDLEDQIDSTRFYYNMAIKSYAADPSLERNAKRLDDYHKSYLDFYNGENQKALGSLLELKNSFLEQDKLDKGDKEILGSVFKLLRRLYTSTNDITAMEMLSRDYETFIENFYKNQLVTNLDDLELKYQTKLKDAEIYQLEESSKRQETVLNQRSLMNWVLLILLILVLGIGILVFKQRRQKALYKTAILEQKLLRSQLNPHFMFNALTTASCLAQKKSSETINYISSLASLLRGILENSREEFISLAEEITTLTNYLDLQSNFSNVFKFTIDIDNQIVDADEILLPPMFIQPFIENTIEHGFRGKEGEEVTILFSIKDKALVCYIQDNGIGYSNTLHSKTSVEKRSLSGKILRERLKLYAKQFKTKASFTINDIPPNNGGGTRVVLTLPLIKDV